MRAAGLNAPNHQGQGARWRPANGIGAELTTIGAAKNGRPAGARPNSFHAPLWGRSAGGSENKKMRRGLVSVRARVFRAGHHLGESPSLSRKVLLRRRRLPHRTDFSCHAPVIRCRLLIIRPPALGAAGGRSRHKTRTRSAIRSGRSGSGHRQLHPGRPRRLSAVRCGH